jgi:hypothetical protein
MSTHPTPPCLICSFLHRLRAFPSRTALDILEDVATLPCACILAQHGPLVRHPHLVPGCQGYGLYTLDIASLGVITNFPFWKPRRSGRGGKKCCPTPGQFLLTLYAAYTLAH